MASLWWRGLQNQDAFPFAGWILLWRFRSATATSCVDTSYIVLKVHTQFFVKGACRERRKHCPLRVVLSFELRREAERTASKTVSATLVVNVPVPQVGTRWHEAVDMAFGSSAKQEDPGTDRVHRISQLRRGR